LLDQIAAAAAAEPGSIRLAVLQSGDTSIPRPEEGHLVVFQCSHTELLKNSDPFKLAADGPDAPGDAQIAVLGHEETRLPLAVVAGLFAMHPGGTCAVAASVPHSYVTKRPFHEPPRNATPRIFHITLLASYPDAACLRSTAAARDDDDDMGSAVQREGSAETSRGGWQPLHVPRVAAKVALPPDSNSTDQTLAGYWVALQLEARALGAPPSLDQGPVVAVGSGAALGFEALTRAQELASLWGADWPDRVGAAASALHAAASSQGAVGFSLGDMPASQPPALVELVETMQEGESALLFCDRGDVQSMAQAGLLTEVAVGGQGAAGAWAAVQVRLASVLQRRDLGGGAIKVRLSRGRGDFPMDCPIQDCRVLLRGLGRAAASGAVFWDSRNQAGAGEDGAVALDLGEGTAPDGLERAVRLMLPGEVALVQVPAGTSDSGCEWGAGPPGEAWEYVVELVGFDALPRLDEMTARELLAHVAATKQGGSRVFARGRVDLAETRYKRALEITKQLLMGLDPEEDGVERSEVVEVSQTCLLNLASCALTTGENAKAVDWCRRAIEEDEHCAKAFLRMAKAKMGIADLDGAASDLASAREALAGLAAAGRLSSVAAVPESDIAAAEAKVKRMVAEGKRKEKAAFGGLFAGKGGL